MTLERRVRMLERQNQRLKRVGLMCVLILGAAVAMGQAGEDQIPKEKEIHGDKIVSKHVYSEAFSLIGPDRKTRAALAMIAGDPVFTIMDKQNSPRIAIKVNKKGSPQIWVVDRKGETKLLLGSQKDGPVAVRVWNASGKANSIHAPK